MHLAEVTRKELHEPCCQTFNEAFKSGAVRAFSDGAFRARFYVSKAVICTTSSRDHGAHSLNFCPWCGENIKKVELRHV